MKLTDADLERAGTLHGHHAGWCQVLEPVVAILGLRKPEMMFCTCGAWQFGVMYVDMLRELRAIRAGLTPDVETELAAVVTILALAKSLGDEGYVYNTEADDDICRSCHRIRSDVLHDGCSIVHALALADEYVSTSRERTS